MTTGTKVPSIQLILKHGVLWVSCAVVIFLLAGCSSKGSLKHEDMPSAAIPSLKNFEATTTIKEGTSGVRQTYYMPGKLADWKKTFDAELSDELSGRPMKETNSEEVGLCYTALFGYKEYIVVVVLWDGKRILPEGKQTEPNTSGTWTTADVFFAERGR